MLYNIQVNKIQVTAVAVYLNNNIICTITPLFPSHRYLLTKAIIIKK